MYCLIKFYFNIILYFISQHYSLHNYNYNVFICYNNNNNNNNNNYYYYYCTLHWITVQLCIM